ncbi:hypothetical protein BC936DRAFT_144411 [Jimgerdemannia flammicorona]|uniref:Uncharacterized protein n=1 Tax=Jimgerdemannia flammicorona TaxID=994334 RepID=A0A433DM48_9FUNG|nr:hypothetical protein BC936DRAFT_144411 [Jimgerdemannia flammicorona]
MEPRWQVPAAHGQGAVQRRLFRRGGLSSVVLEAASKAIRNVAVLKFLDFVFVFVFDFQLKYIL